MFILWPLVAVQGCRLKPVNAVHTSLNVRPILHIEAGSNNHPAKVPEAVLPTHNEERLIKVRMVFSQLLLLDFSKQATQTQLWDKHQLQKDTAKQWRRTSLDGNFLQRQKGLFYVWKPFHLSLFFLFLDHLDLTVLSLGVPVAYSTGMLWKIRHEIVRISLFFFFF